MHNIETSASSVRNVTKASHFDTKRFRSPYLPPFPALWHIAMKANFTHPLKTQEISELFRWFWVLYSFVKASQMADRIFADIEISKSSSVFRRVLRPATQRGRLVIRNQAQCSVRRCLHRSPLFSLGAPENSQCSSPPRFRKLQVQQDNHAQGFGSNHARTGRRLTRSC